MTLGDVPYRPIEGLVLDMDGLLVDTEHLAGVALERFLARHGRTIVPGTLEQTLGRRLPEAIALVAEIYELSGDVPALVEEYGDLRLDALRGNVRPMPGAPELLVWARSVGLPLALATSSRRSHAELSLAESGLAGLFDAEVTGAEVANGKPAPDIFLLAAARLGVPADRCVVLEDAPAGLMAAAAAGMGRLWIPNEKTRGLTVAVEVDARLENLDEARRWLVDRLQADPEARLAGTTLG